MSDLMTFNDKYPHAKQGDMPEPDIFRGRFVRPCSSCKTHTHWVDFDMKVPVCSEECLKTLIVDHARSSDPALHKLLTVGTKNPTSSS